MPRALLGAGSTAVNKIDIICSNVVYGFTREAAAIVISATKEIANYKRVSYDYEGYKGKQYNEIYWADFGRDSSNSLVTMKSTG